MFRLDLSRSWILVDPAQLVFFYANDYGALLLLVAEQAFYHAHSIGFPHYRFVNEILLPVSGLLGTAGVAFIAIGLWFDRPPHPPPRCEPPRKDQPG